MDGCSPTPRQHHENFEDRNVLQSHKQCRHVLRATTFDLYRIEQIVANRIAINRMALGTLGS